MCLSAWRNIPAQATNALPTVSSFYEIKRPVGVVLKVF
jgi:hypothetical protein